MKTGEHEEELKAGKKGFLASYMPETTWGKVLLVGVIAGVGAATGGVGVPAVLSLWGTYKGYKNAAAQGKSKVWGAIKGSFLGAAVAVVGAIVGPAIAAVGVAIGLAGYGVKEYRDTKAREVQQSSHGMHSAPKYEGQQETHARHKRTESLHIPRTPATAKKKSRTI